MTARALADPSATQPLNSRRKAPFAESFLFHPGAFGLAGMGGSVFPAQDIALGPVFDAQLPQHVE